MLENLVIGWQDIEPVFVANLALKKPFILLGRHGTCKTTCARMISKIYGQDGFRFYDATKDDLVSIAGIPIPEELAKGKLEFSCHERSIWKAKVIVVDELTRANKENQNLWLEILEERTCFGKKLEYETFIATMNPESYTSTFKLDEALLDRFYAVLPVPDLQKEKSETFKRLLRLNLQERAKRNLVLKEAIRKIRENYNMLFKNEKIVEAVQDYVANLIEILLGQVSTYISPRKCLQLAEEILVVASYYILQKEKGYLEKAARKCLIYTLSVPLKIEPSVLLRIHKTLKAYLTVSSISETERIRIELSKLKEPEQLLSYIEQNIAKITKNLEKDETEKIFLQLLERIKDKEHLVLKLDKVLKNVAGHEEIKRRVDGKAVLYIEKSLKGLIREVTERSIQNQNDVLLLEKLKKFTEKFKRFPLPKNIQDLLAEKIEPEKLLEVLERAKP